MSKTKKILDLPKQERPYEKCLKDGTCALSDAELLAVIIRTGLQGENSVVIAQKILELSDINSGILGISHMGIEELMQIKGVGKVKAVQVKCIMELSKRIAMASAKKRLSFQRPETIAEYYMEDMRHEEQEKLRLLLLNTKNHLIKEQIISIGTVNSSIITPREIFIEALKCRAVFIILIHNHPSGDPSPSREDILLTNRMKECGELLEVLLLDHIIIGDNQFYSFRANGII